MAQNLIRIKVVATKLGNVHENYAWKRIKSDPLAPTPIRLGARLTVFDEADVDRWISGMVKAAINKPTRALPSPAAIRAGAVKRKATAEAKRIASSRIQGGAA